MGKKKKKVVVTDKLINKLSGLAKLEFDETSKEKIKQDLQNMISFLEKLNELDLKDAEPMEYINSENNVLREDEIIESITREGVLSNSPVKDEKYFKVPKVLKR